MKTLGKSILIPYATVAIIAATSVSFAEETSSPIKAAVDTTQIQITPDGRINVVGANLPLERIASKLSDLTTATVRARGTTMQRTVPSYILRELTLEQALNKLVDSIPGLILYQPADKPDTYEIWDQESYRREVLPQCVRPKVFIPKHVQAEEIVMAIEGLVTPGAGSIAFDVRSNKVFVTDLPQVIELMEAVVEQIDVGLNTHVFSVVHADVKDLASKLNTLRSPGSPELIADGRTRQIIVKDRTEKIAEMEKLVEILDISVSDELKGR